MFVFSQCVTWVVFHFYGETIRFAVWANGTQYSVLVNFVPESHLPFAYKSVSFTRNGGEKQKNIFRHSVAPGNFPLKFLEQSSGVLSNCIFVNGKQPCSPSWRFRTMPMTSCNGSIFHLPRLLDFLHCCSLQMWAQRWIYRARRIQ